MADIPRRFQNGGRGRHFLVAFLFSTEIAVSLRFVVLCQWFSAPEEGFRTFLSHISLHIFTHTSVHFYCRFYSFYFVSLDTKKRVKSTGNCNWPPGLVRAVHFFFNKNSTEDSNGCCDMESSVLSFLWINLKTDVDSLLRSMKALHKLNFSQLAASD